MKLFLAIPSSRYNFVEPIGRILAWAQETKHDLRIEIDATYGVDTGRSRLIERAKKWGADKLLMVDSDVVPSTPIGDVLSFANEGFSRCYACVISPMLSITGQIMVRAPEGSPDFKGPWEVPSDKLFEIRYGAMGLAVIQGEALGKLKILDEHQFVNGEPTPMYCLFTPGISEDHSLQINIRESTGRKIGADPRIQAGHVKWREIPSWRGMAQRGR